MHIVIFGRKGLGSLKFCEKTDVLNQVSDITNLEQGLVYDLFEETIRAVESMVTPEDTIDCVNMDTPDGLKLEEEQNIFYVPTIAVYENKNMEKELAFIENVGVMTPGMPVHDINYSSKWWDDLRVFLDDLDSFRCQE